MPPLMPDPSWMERVKEAGLALLVAMPGFMAWLKGRKVASAVQEIHVTMNSRLDELLKVTKESAHAQGVLDQKTKAIEEDRLRQEGPPRAVEKPL